MAKRRKYKGDKMTCQKSHFIKKTWVRMGVDINEELYLKIVRGIQNGDFHFLDSQSKRVSRHLVTFDLDNQRVKIFRAVVLYDNNTKQLITVLKPDEGQFGKKCVEK